MRRWPAGTDAATLQFIHTVLSHSRDRGFDGVPRLASTTTGETVVCRSGRYFDAQEWAAGAALAAADAGDAPVPNPVCPLAPERLAHLAAALAGFHRSTSDLSPLPAARRPPFAERLAEMRSDLESQQAAIEAWLRIESDGGLRALAHAWLTLLPSALAGAAAALGAHADLPESSGAAIHGDLWAPHIFFDGAAFAGFIDFEGLAWDAPAIDLAQVILHFNGWQERATVLKAYAERRPLTATDLTLLPAAAVLDLAGEGLWALGLFAAVGDRPPQCDRHIANLRALLASLRILA